MAEYMDVDKRCIYCVGDSHARALYGACAYIANRSNAAFYLKTRYNRHRSAEFNHSFLNYFNSVKNLSRHFNFYCEKKLILLSVSVETKAHKAGDYAGFQAYLQSAASTITYLTNKGISTFYVEDPSRYPTGCCCRHQLLSTPVDDIYFNELDTPLDGLFERNLSILLANNSRFGILPMNKYLCVNETVNGKGKSVFTCPSVYYDKYLMRDTTHLNMDGALAVAPALLYELFQYPTFTDWYK